MTLILIKFGALFRKKLTNFRTVLQSCAAFDRLYQTKELRWQPDGSGIG